MIHIIDSKFCHEYYINFFSENDYTFFFDVYGIIICMIFMNALLKGV
jgi:hypothetical protein